MVNVMFFGFGMFKEKEMMEVITGRKDIRGNKAKLKGHALGIQNIGSIPEPAQGIIRKCWKEEGDSFRSYVIVRDKDSEGVSGIVWEISEEELARIEEWELDGPMNWTYLGKGIAYLEDGTAVKVATLPISENQKVDEWVDGFDYPPYLMRKERFVEAINFAMQMREERLARESGETKRKMSYT